MDIYTDPYEKIGKLRSEMFRACRLVVDTGIHYYNWSKATAVEYMLNNCMVSIDKIENEIRRYITWPGQACSYKIGQMKITELRHSAEKQLGSRFNIKEFHHIILSMSSVPLHLLEKHVNAWIEEQR